jgi:hypothetical protein
LAGAAQVFALDQKTDYLRRGQVIKTTHETRFGVTSLYPDEAHPDTLLASVRGYWAIEIQQHYRRDHTQREDHCHVRHPITARNLALMRSLAIFLYEHQRARPEGKTSLPDWQAHNHRHPNSLIRRLLVAHG